MKKDNRLRKNHDFQRIINSKQSLVSKHLVVYYLPNNLGKMQVGISISKKFANAVGRNKLRRQVRAILDVIDPFDKPMDIVIILRKPFLKDDFNSKLESLKQLLKRI